LGNKVAEIKVIEQNIELKRNDITLSGVLFIPEGNKKNPAVIIAHGLPSTPAPVQEKGYDSLGRKICALGAISIIFNFSGCKGSGGFFSLKNWTKDLELVSNYIWNLEYVDPSRVAFLAFSMGTIPTIYYVAHQNKTASPIFLIICACPADLPDARLGDLRLGIQLTNQIEGIRIEKEYDSQMLLEFKEYMPFKWIASIPVPKYILHGRRDDLINVKNAHSLYEKAIEPKKLIILKNAGHKLRQDATALGQIINIIQNNL
jgi:dienelactone hydrolase